jgi:sec-independent protein translocase protein TatB
VSTGEILLIMVIALLVLGPEKLPKLAAEIGRWLGRARAMARQLSAQLDQEVQVEQLLRERAQSTPTPAASRPAPTPSAACADRGDPPAAGPGAPLAGGPADEPQAHPAPAAARSDVQP